MNVLHNIKYKSNSKYKTVYNCAIPYLMAQIITGLLIKEEIRLQLINIVIFILNLLLLLLNDKFCAYKVIDS